MDRDAIARGRRRAQAAEALEFEQERERALREQVEALVLEAEQPRIDAEAFARLEPSEVAIVQEALGEVFWDEQDEEDTLGEDGYLDLGGTEPEDYVEEEIARLGEEIDRSRAVQAALRRYLAALDAPRE